MWFYQLSGKECGPVSEDELRFLLQSGIVPRDSLVRGEESSQWQSATSAGLIVRKTAGPAKERKSMAPAASFAQDFRERPKARAADATPPTSTPAETAGPKLPPALKTDREKDNRGPMIAAIVAGIALLLLLLLLFYNRTENRGMADSGDGSGAQEQGEAQSSGASDSEGQSEAAGQTDATDPASEATSGASTTAADATDAAASAASDTATAQTGGDQSDAASDTPAGSENDMAADGDTGLAVGEGDNSRFSIAAPGETTFFGLKGSGRRFTYIVDCSGSMSGAPLARATQELIESLDRLPKHVEFQIIFFDDLAYTYPQSGFASISDDRKPEVKRFVAGINGGGGTNVKIALDAAFRSRTKPDTIFLLTDGQFDPDTPNYSQRLNSNRKSRINTVAFISNAGEPLLKEIASKNRGDYRFVP